MRGLPGVFALLALPALGGEVIDERWYALEETLFAYETGAEAMAGDAGLCLANQAARWRESLDAACTGAACREAAFRDRLGALSTLQPEGAYWLEMDLPETPRLVAVLAPEHTEAELPRDFDVAPDLAAEGVLRMEWDSLHHMGLALDSGADEPHVLIFLMELGGIPNHDRLLGIVDARPDARYRVTGVRAESPESGGFNFDTTRCRYIYRLD